MVNLKYRSAELEVMDDLDLPSADIDPVLKGLGLMNHLTGSHRAIIKTLEKLGLKGGMSVSDWGCGGGDLLIAINRHAQKNNINLKLEGVDAAPAAIKFAEQKCAVYKNISFKQADVLIGDFVENSTDYVVSGLFTHHFADADWIELVKRMRHTAAKAVIITDLHRHWLMYYAVKVLTAFTFNRMAMIDGPLSVKRAFKRKELEALLAKAQIRNYKIKWLWPFRWQLVIYKN